jgi:hypothetical protein
MFQFYAFGVVALGTLLAVPLIAYGILRAHLFDIDLRIRWTIKQSTLAAAVVAIIYALSEGASRLRRPSLATSPARINVLPAPLQRFAIASQAQRCRTREHARAPHRKLQVTSRRSPRPCRAAGSRKRTSAAQPAGDTLGIAKADADALERDLQRGLGDGLSRSGIQPVRVFLRHADPCAVSDDDLRAPPPAAGWRTFNARLLHECLQTRDDVAGRLVRDPLQAGYVVRLLCRMHVVADLRRARAQAAPSRAVPSHRRWADLEGRELAMTDCWINVMPRLVVHSLHLHPLSTISGTTCARRAAPGLKFEDPRLDRFMAAPPPPDCRTELQPGYRAGDRGSWCCSRAGCATSPAEPGGGRARQHRFNYGGSGIRSSLPDECRLANWRRSIRRSRSASAARQSAASNRCGMCCGQSGPTVTVRMNACSGRAL